MSLPKTTRYGVDPLLAEELANKRYVDAQTGAGIDLSTLGDLHGFSTVDARIPIGTNDQVLTADSAQALGLKWAAAAGGGLTFAKDVKPADETVTSTTTLQDDDDLVITPNINKTYGYMLMCMFTSDTPAGFRYAASIPSGATMTRVAGQNWNSTLEGTMEDMTTAKSVTTSGTFNHIIQVVGRLIMGGTAGDVNFQWAQNISDAADTTVQEGAFWIWWEEN